MIIKYQILAFILNVLTSLNPTYAARCIYFYYFLKFLAGKTDRRQQLGLWLQCTHLLRDSTCLNFVVYKLMMCITEGRGSLLTVLIDLTRPDLTRPIATFWPTDLRPYLHIHRVQKKRATVFFLHNFNKCRHSFVIFGTSHPEDSFLTAWSSLSTSTTKLNGIYQFFPKEV